METYKILTGKYDMDAGANLVAAVSLIISTMYVCERSVVHVAVVTRWLARNRQKVAVSFTAPYISIELAVD